MPHFKTIALVLCDGLHSVCGVCSSPNKSTSYLSLCLSLNSFCDETSRTWSLLGPETRSVTSVGKLWGLGGFESQTEVKFQFYLFFFFFFKKRKLRLRCKMIFPKVREFIRYSTVSAISQCSYGENFLPSSSVLRGWEKNERGDGSHFWATWPGPLTRAKLTLDCTPLDDI